MATQTHSTVQWKFCISCLVLVFLAFDLLSLSNWRNAVSPEHAGSLAASFGPGDKHRRVILELEERSPLAALGAEPGNELTFDRATDEYRVLGLDETIGITLYTQQGPRSVTLKPVQERNVAQNPGAYAAGFFAQFLCALFALVLAFMLAMRRPESGAMRALAIGLLVDSLDFSTTFLPGSLLQNVLTHYLRPPIVLFCVLGFFYFALTFPEDRQWFRLRRIRVGFSIVAAIMAGVALAYTIDRTYGLTPAGSVLLKQLRSVIFMTCYVLTLGALYASWRSSEGTMRHRLTWIGACVGVPLLTYFISNAVSLMQLMSDRHMDIYGSLATAAAYVGLGYALLRYQLFNFSFAVNRTLVFTLTSLLLFLAFWLIEQVVHNLVHFEAVENNAMLGGAIAFGLFFGFNRLHHRVDHWIEQLFFRQWRAKESALRAFVSKAAHFLEVDSLILAFGVALDRFSDRGGNAIYLTGPARQFHLVHSTLAGAPAVLAADDDIAVTLRNNHKGASLAQSGHSLQAELALPMLQGDELKGIVILGAKPGAHSYRPDEQLALESATTRIGLDLNRLETARLSQEMRHLQKDLELRRHQERILQQELESLKEQRATLHLALSKVGPPDYLLPKRFVADV